MQAISLRPLSDGDSLDELTAMLHRAFSRLGQMGLNCTCVDQSVAVTRERIEKGACYVAVCDGRLVGTITLYGPDPGIGECLVPSTGSCQHPPVGCGSGISGQGPGYGIAEICRRLGSRAWLSGTRPRYPATRRASRGVLHGPRIPTRRVGKVSGQALPQCRSEQGGGGAGQHSCICAVAPLSRLPSRTVAQIWPNRTGLGHNGSDVARHDVRQVVKAKGVCWKCLGGQSGTSRYRVWDGAQ